MKEFQITRYIQRWWWVIAVLSAVCGILFYSFISSRQTYRAQTLIEYTNDRASDGLYPSGDEIDVQEIRSSSVIANALESIGMSDSVDAVRSRISISANISEQDSAIQTAKWANGVEYDFFPTQYIITYTSTNKESSTDARRILEAIMDSYIRLYSEKYVSISKVPNSVESLQNLNYDYIEWAEVIDSFIKSDREYLTRMKNMRTNFRSSATGYSFQDLFNEYNLVYKVYLPSLYATILDNHVTTDRDLLLSRYEYRINQNNLAIKNYEDSLVLVEEMIESYTEKNHATMDYHWNESEEDGNTRGSSYVIGQVYSFDGQSAESTEVITYDNILDRYVDLRSNIATKKEDNEYCNYVLAAFKNAGQTVNPEDVAEVEALIALIEGKLKVLDSLLTATAAEHSEVETIRNVRVRSTVNVKEVTNVKLYTVMIVAVFFAIGVGGAVVVGRSMDFIEYRFYTDSSTGLPNRLRCDGEIERYAKKVLAVPFSCVVVMLTNMNEINNNVGREMGNEILKIFAGNVKDCAENLGFVGYNGGLQFLGLFPGCDEGKALFFKNLLIRVIAEFNRGGHGTVIRFKVAMVTATSKTPRTIHELISSSMRQLRLEKEIIAESEQIGDTN